VERTTIAGETKVLGENLPQRHFVPPQIPDDQVRFRTPDRSGGKPATSRLSYGAALSLEVTQAQYRLRLKLDHACTWTHVCMYNVCIVKYLGLCDYRRGMEWLLDILTTSIHLSELHFTDHWHIQTTVLSLLQSPLAVSWQRLLSRGILQLPAFRSSCLMTTQLTVSQAGGHFTPTFYSFFHRLTSNWQLNPLTHQPAILRHLT
jgi:hypothetical protein